LSLIKHTFLYTIGRVLPQTIGFFLLPIYTDYLTLDEYGVVESMYILTMVLTVFFSMATERSMFRLYYDYDNVVEKKLFIGNISILIIAFSIIVLLLLFVFSNQISYIYKGIPFSPYFIYAILTAFFMAFSFIPQTLYQVKGKALHFLWLTLSGFFIGIGFMIYYLVVLNYGAIGLIKGRFYGVLTMFPAYLYIIYKSSIFKINKKVIVSILKFSIPMIPTLLTAWVLNMSNRIFIEQYFSLKEVGIFSLAFRISSLATVVLGGLFSAFNPIFYNLANHKNQLESKEKLKKLCKGILYIVVLVCFSLSFLSKEIILIFFNKDYLESINIIPLIIVSIFLINISGLYNLMIYQEKKSRTIMSISIIGAALSIGFNFLLVPTKGMIGAALASVLAALAMLVLKFIYAKKTYYVDLPIPNLLFWFLLSGIIIAIDLNLMINIYISLIFKVLIMLISIFIIYKKNKKLIMQMVT